MRYDSRSSHDGNPLQPRRRAQHWPVSPCTLLSALIPLYESYLSAVKVKPARVMMPGAFCRRAELPKCRTPGLDWKATRALYRRASPSTACARGAKGCAQQGVIPLGAAGRWLRRRRDLRSLGLRRFDRLRCDCSGGFHPLPVCPLPLDIRGKFTRASGLHDHVIRPSSLPRTCRRNSVGCPAPSTAATNIAP
jgi:hypothetical protein